MGIVAFRDGRTEKSLRAEQLHICIQSPRVVFIVETAGKLDSEREVRTSVGRNVDAPFVRRANSAKVPIRARAMRNLTAASVVFTESFPPFWATLLLAILFLLAKSLHQLDPCVTIT